MKLHIRNMQSERCIMLVKKELYLLGISFHTVNLEGVTIRGKISVEKRLLFDMKLKHLGLELINEKEIVLIETIKNCINEYIYLNECLPKQNLSDYLSTKLKCDYSAISNTFSAAYGSSLEKFLISEKIKQVKVLLSQKELSLNDIAYQLRYSSTAHLSNQFKKATGNTLASFRANT